MKFIFIILFSWLSLMISSTAASKSNLAIFGGTINCCCGSAKEKFYPNLNFEAPPKAPAGGWIDYDAGQSYAGWDVSAGSISIHDGAHGNMGLGNPNGSSQHMDLNGHDAGSVSYTLTGLTAGYTYTITLWYAKHIFGTGVGATLLVNNGSLLDVSWTADNDGDKLWLPAMFEFKADKSVAIMTFIGSSDLPWFGMLIDDIHIFECANDLEQPKITNPNKDMSVDCIADVPNTQNIQVIDNCDKNPSISFEESTTTISPCELQINRNWKVLDACGNLAESNQIISIADKQAPNFKQNPKNKIVYCEQNIINEFSSWINSNGNAIATDNCGIISWKVNFEREPKTSCDSVNVAFIVIDACGNESIRNADYIVKDTHQIRITKPAQSVHLSCATQIKDSLLNWLKYAAYMQASVTCDTLIYTNNFNGDFNVNPLQLRFYVYDRCGHIDSSSASFSYLTANDTFRFKEYICDIPFDKADTMHYVVGSCDSIVIHQQLKLNSSNTFLELQTCDPSQKLKDTILLTNQYLCDSTVFINYTLHPIKYTQLTIQDCSVPKYRIDSIRLQGHFCDSFVIRKYIPLRKDSINHIKFSCDSNLAGLKILHFINTEGCDSTVYATTLYRPQIITTINKYQCALIKNYSDTLNFPNSSCDSLVITNHISLPVSQTTIQSTTCNKNKAGTFQMILTNQFGCDSTITETIHLLPSDTTSLQRTTCRFSDSGIKKYNLINQFGCDSLIVENIIFIPSDTIYQVDTTCHILMARQDTVLLHNQNLCDSLIYRNTVYLPITLDVRVDSIKCNNATNGRLSLEIKNNQSANFSTYLNHHLYNNKILFENLVAGIYEINIVDQNQCTSDTLFVELNNPPPLQSDLGNDKTVLAHENIILHLNTNFLPTRILWRPGDITICSNCTDVNFHLDKGSWIYTLAEDEHGCLSYDSVFIAIKNITKVYAPNVISPNGDNLNDYFILFGDSDVEIVQLSIFDRWGEEVYSKNNIPINIETEGWDGLYRTKKVNPGVFVYKATLKFPGGKIEIISGELTLIR